MYPIRPKSTSSLKAGQYWTFTMKNGEFACGVVLARCLKDEKVDTRMFLAGLIDWHGARMPRPAELEGRPVIARGYAHLKAITETGGEIQGQVSAWASPEVVSISEDFPTWGFNAIRILAEKHHGENGRTSR